MSRRPLASTSTALFWLRSPLRDGVRPIVGVKGHRTRPTLRRPPEVRPLLVENRWRVARVDPRARRTMSKERFDTGQRVTFEGVCATKPRGAVRPFETGRPSLRPPRKARDSAPILREGKTASGGVGCKQDHRRTPTPLITDLSRANEKASTEKQTGVRGRRESLTTRNIPPLVPPQTKNLARPLLTSAHLTAVVGPRPYGPKLNNSLCTPSSTLTFKFPYIWGFGPSFRSHSRKRSR